MKARSSSQPPSGLSSFGTFLDVLQRPSQGESGPSSKPAPMLLLRQLVDGPEPVATLLQECGLGVVEFAEVLKRMREADLVAVSTTASGEEVSLTSIGRQLLTVAVQSK